MNVIKWLAKNTSSLEGKKIAVTGSTGGIGVEPEDKSYKNYNVYDGSVFDIYREAVYE